MAETEGFEPPEPVRVLHLSSVYDVCRGCRNRAILHLKHARFGVVRANSDPYGTLDCKPAVSR